MTTLAVTLLFAILQLRVWYPEHSAAPEQGVRIVDRRAVEMILNIAVITAIVSLVFFTMRFAYRQSEANSGVRSFIPITSQGSICIMLAFLSVAYGSFVQLVWLADVEGMPIVQGILCIPLIAFFIWRNSDRFKLSFQVWPTTMNRFDPMALLSDCRAIISEA